MRDYILVEGDLLDADVDFICHQVNCQGKMRSGVAKAIRERYPKVYEQYMWLYNGSKGQDLLGKIQIVPLYSEMSQFKANNKSPYACINMFAQNNYGYDGKQYTSLEAFKSCLEMINKHGWNKTVAFPWLIGCVRGGADWNVVLPMILETLTNVREIKFYKL